MAERERVREELTRPLTRDDLEARERDGWRAVSVVWERRGGAAAAPGVRRETPYGLRVAADCRSLEADPGEEEVLRAMLELIVDDQPLWRVAEELNRRGYTTRGRQPWTQVAVFQLLPRLTEAAPRIFATRDWTEMRRRRFLTAVS